MRYLVLVEASIGVSRKLKEVTSTSFTVAFPPRKPTMPDAELRIFFFSQIDIELSAHRCEVVMVAQCDVEKRSLSIPLMPSLPKLHPRIQPQGPPPTSQIEENEGDED
ncbi:hypothetical protein PanWU01x14_368150 [Parasponia andersonii]|uniref:Uncharacterized protein n=1 Tax=Parasponia andersonii TaxID=3476 RepID=A0A2P5A545_PARAD|nr:hypothetical protein PanWU01x14_368150 [Parasponia andersonii]